MRRFKAIITRIQSQEIVIEFHDEAGRDFINDSFMHAAEQAEWTGMDTEDFIIESVRESL